MLKKHAGIFSGFCTKNILFCTNSRKFCTKTWNNSRRNRRKYERNFPRHRVIVRFETEKWWNFMRKREKSPLLCRELLRNPSKRVKTSTPHLDREGLVPPFQAPFKEKTPVFALHALHTIIYLSLKNNQSYYPMTRLLYISEGCEELKRVIFYIIYLIQLMMMFFL